MRLNLRLKNFKASRPRSHQRRKHTTIESRWGMFIALVVNNLRKTIKVSDYLKEIKENECRKVDRLEIPTT